jgi:hypothetical protein
LSKGDPLDPENCRAMTLVSCFGKLFTSILNKRLTLFSNQTEILKEKQTGFRKGYSTTDNINTKLKILQYILLITGDITLRYSLAIPSIPDAFLFFKYYIASLISVSVISEFSKDSQTVLILLFAIFVGLRRRREFPHSIL